MDEHLATVLASGQVIRPGDRLVIGFTALITDEMFAKMRAQVEEHLPGVKLTVFDGVSSFGVYRPDET